MNYSYGYDTFPATDNTTYYGYDDTFNRLALARRLLAQPHNIAEMTLSFFAMTFNALSLFALSRVRNRSTAHFQLIKSLACSDILIALTVTIHGINRAFNPVLRDMFVGSEAERRCSFCAYMVIKAVYAASLNITLFNLLLMAIDHYVAIMKPLYQLRLMTRTKISLIISAVWILSFVLGFMDFYAEFYNVPRIQNIFGANFCEAIYITRFQDEYCVFALTMIIYPIMLFLYIRICLYIHNLKAPGQNLQMHASFIRKEVVQKRNKKAAGTTLLILCTFSICWLPNFLFQITMSIYAELTRPNPPNENMWYILQQFDKIFVILLLLNCCADPLIYSFRLREIRFGYRRLFRCDSADSTSLS